MILKTSSVIKYQIVSINRIRKEQISNIKIQNQELLRQIQLYHHMELETSK